MKHVLLLTTALLVPFSAAAQGDAGLHFLEVGEKLTINRFGICREVVNSSNDRVFIPYETSKEYFSFLAGPPSGVSTKACNPIEISGDIPYVCSAGTKNVSGVTSGSATVLFGGKAFDDTPTDYMPSPEFSMNTIPHDACEPCTEKEIKDGAYQCSGEPQCTEQIWDEKFEMCGNFGYTVTRPTVVRHIRNFGGACGINHDYIANHGVCEGTTQTPPPPVVITPPPIIAPPPAIPVEPPQPPPPVCVESSVNVTISCTTGTTLTTGLKKITSNTNNVCNATTETVLSNPTCGPTVCTPVVETQNVNTCSSENREMMEVAGKQTRTMNVDGVCGSASAWVVTQPSVCSCPERRETFKLTVCTPEKEILVSEGVWENIYNKDNICDSTRNGGLGANAPLDKITELVPFPVEVVKIQCKAPDICLPEDLKWKLSTDTQRTFVVNGVSQSLLGVFYDLKDTRTNTVCGTTYETAAIGVWPYKIKIREGDSMKEYEGAITSGHSSNECLNNYGDTTLVGWPFCSK